MESSVNTYYNSDWNCIVNTFRGSVDKTTMDEMLQNMVTISEVHDCKRCIHDIRQATNMFSITELYFLPEKMVQKGFDRTWKRAIVANERFKEAEFYEDTANNRGIKVKVFTSMEDALKWL